MSPISMLNGSAHGARERQQMHRSSQSCEKRPGLLPIAQMVAPICLFSGFIGEKGAPYLPTSARMLKMWQNLSLMPSSAICTKTTTLGLFVVSRANVLVFLIQALNEQKSEFLLSHPLCLLNIRNYPCRDAWHPRIELVGSLWIYLAWDPLRQRLKVIRRHYGIHPALEHGPARLRGEFLKHPSWQTVPGAAHGTPLRNIKERGQQPAVAEPYHEVHFGGACGLGLDKRGAEEGFVHRRSPGAFTLGRVGRRNRVSCQPRLRSSVSRRLTDPCPEPHMPRRSGTVRGMNMGCSRKQVLYSGMRSVQR